MLKVSNHDVIEKNPAMAPFIKETLAPGVYLMAFKSDDEAASVMGKNNLDYVGSIKTAFAKNSAALMPAGIGRGRNLFDELGYTEKKKDADAAAMKSVLQGFADSLLQMELSEEQREGLEDRIARKIIVNAEQLRAESVRFEQLEAGGIDYSGKIHILESALQSKSMVEITLASFPEPVKGLPVMLSKKSGEAELVIELESTHRQETILVSAAVNIKKLRNHIDY